MERDHTNGTKVVQDITPVQFLKSKILFQSETLMPAIAKGKTP